MDSEWKGSRKLQSRVGVGVRDDFTATTLGRRASCKRVFFRKVGVPCEAITTRSPVPQQEHKPREVAYYGLAVLLRVYVLVYITLGFRMEQKLGAWVFKDT